MAVKRLGHMRPPDSTSNIWGIPDYGTELRESPGPIVTEAHMSAASEKRSVAPANAEVTPGSHRKRAVRTGKPQWTPTITIRPEAEPVKRRNINIRVPMDILDRFMEPGPGYQSRMIEVLRLFLDEGGQFIIEEIQEDTPEK